MNEYIKNERLTCAIKKSEIATALLNPNFKDIAGNARVVLQFILKNGEKATMHVENYEEAQNLLEDL